MIAKECIVENIITGEIIYCDSQQKASELIGTYPEIVNEVLNRTNKWRWKCRQYLIYYKEEDRVSLKYYPGKKNDFFDIIGMNDDCQWKLRCKKCKKIIYKSSIITPGTIQCYVCKRRYTLELKKEKDKNFVPRRRFVCIHKDTGERHEYNSPSWAADELNISRQAISMLLHRYNNNKHVGDYEIKYLDKEKTI
jgi:hypothetical protein